MNLTEALAIAANAKPASRKLLTKRQISTIRKRLSAGTTELTKRFDGLSGTVATMQKSLNQIAADVEYLEHFTPGAPPRRLQS